MDAKFDLCFSFCQVEKTYRQHVQLTEVEAPEAPHVEVVGTPAQVKQVNNTQFERGSWLVADFDGLYFVGQVRRGELNGTVLVNYLHQVVGRINRYTWPAPEDCYETSLDDIFMSVVGAPCPTGGKKRTQFQLDARDEIVAAHHRFLNR